METKSFQVLVAIQNKDLIYGQIKQQYQNCYHNANINCKFSSWLSFHCCSQRNDVWWCIMSWFNRTWNADLAKGSFDVTFQNVDSSKNAFSNIKEKRSSHLSIDSSMLTPFCIFFEVSTVRYNSTMRQFDFSNSFEQSYGRKFIILKWRIALTPLYTLDTASEIPRLTLAFSKSKSLSALMDDPLIP